MPAASKSPDGNEWSGPMTHRADARRPKSEALLSRRKLHAPLNSLVLERVDHDVLGLHGLDKSIFYRDVERPLNGFKVDPSGIAGVQHLIDELFGRLGQAGDQFHRLVVMGIGPYRGLVDGG